MSGPRGPGGFTLIEIMAVTALLAVFVGATASLSAQLFGGYRLAEQYGQDVLDCQRTLEAIRRDVGAASRVAPRPQGGLRVGGPAGEIVYRLAGGVCERVAGREARTLARNLASLRATVEGNLVRIELALRARRATAAAPAIRTAVRMRSEAGQ